MLIELSDCLLEDDDAVHEFLDECCMFLVIDKDM